MANQPQNSKRTHKKLPRLDPTLHKITKRPLLHPAIAPPRSNASNPKIVYVSPSTPFIATVKRVRKLLSYVEERATGPISLSSNPRAALKTLQECVNGTTSGKDRERGEEVVMKGTGRAIEKVLRLGLYWQGQEDVLVSIKTVSVGAVDDVVGVKSGEGAGFEESRVRRVSCLEVGVRLR